MKKGFTLIELLVVIAIIGILSTIVLTSINSAQQKRLGAPQDQVEKVRSWEASQLRGAPQDQVEKVRSWEASQLRGE